MFGEIYHHNLTLIVIFLKLKYKYKCILFVHYNNKSYWKYQCLCMIETIWKPVIFSTVGESVINRYKDR